MWMRCLDNLVDYLGESYIIIKDTKGVHHIWMHEIRVPCDRELPDSFYYQDGDQVGYFKLEWRPVQKSSEPYYETDDGWTKYD